MDKKKNYKEYLRRSFVQYAMVLFSAMALLVVSFFVFDYVVSVVKQNNHANRDISALFQEEYERYRGKVVTLTQKESLPELLHDSTIPSHADISRELYDFANSGRIRARFVLLDRDGAVCLGNLTAANQEAFSESLFVKRILSRVQDKPEETLALLCDVELSSGQECAYSFVRPVTGRDGVVAGCLVLNMRTDDMEALASDMNEDYLLLDRYGNAVFSSFRLPVDPGDKLPSRRFTQDIRENGICRVDGERMYVSLTHLAESEIDVLTFTSIERRLQLYRMAGVFFVMTLLILGILMMLMTRLYTGINERGVGDLMRDLEVKNLEEQFNPHFVFNVMESVYFQIDEDPKKAQEMLLAFSTLMRYSINHGHSKVRLETDVDYLNDFLMLQKIRYNQLLSYRFDIPDELLDCLVPKLILQPVMENCIRHGFVSGRELHIDISARHEGRDLVFQISDNGKGITEETLATIRARLREEMSEETVRHIGLYHVEKVLSMLYGERYGLTIKSRPDEGTRVTLTMPYETEDEHV